jgi:hypothetical protein
VYVYCICFNLVAGVLALNLMTAFFIDAFETASADENAKKKINKQVMLIRINNINVCFETYVNTASYTIGFRIIYL